MFDNTVATYNYYRLLGLQDEVVMKGNRYITIWDMIVSMVANAWYPVVNGQQAWTGSALSLHRQSTHPGAQQSGPLHTLELRLARPALEPHASRQQHQHPIFYVNRSHNFTPIVKHC